jgi:hypothetical protein
MGCKPSLHGGQLLLLHTGWNLGVIKQVSVYVHATSSCDRSCVQVTFGMPGVQRAHNRLCGALGKPGLLGMML